jgi:hypothetical protein
VRRATRRRLTENQSLGRRVSPHIRVGRVVAARARLRFRFFQRNPELLPRTCLILVLFAKDNIRNELCKVGETKGQSDH